MRVLSLIAATLAVAAGTPALAQPAYQDGQPRNGYMQPGNPDRGVPNGDPRQGYGDRDDRGRGDGGDRRTVRCESRNNRPQRCDIGRADRVRLDRQLSDRPCVEGRSWFQDRRSVTVTNGCRADFRVRG
jgi:hypothetical protein